MSVKVDINTAKILKVRGLGSSKDAQKFLASTIVNFADPYVPMSSGAGAHMKNQTQIPQDGSYIKYGGGAFPYVHYQFVGEVYGPNYTNGERFWSGKAPKKPTGRKLTYHGAPMRGPNWVARMMADKSREVTETVELYIKQKGG